MRLGCYGPVKEAMGVTSDNPSLARKIAAGSVSGGVAAGVTNPLDLIKTRMQSKANPHKTMIASTRAVLAEGGVKGLWRGSGPSMVRVECLIGYMQLSCALHKSRYSQIDCSLTAVLWRYCMLHTAAAPSIQSGSSQRYTDSGCSS